MKHYDIMKHYLKHYLNGNITIEISGKCGRYYKGYLLFIQLRYLCSKLYDNQSFTTVPNNDP